MNLRTVLHIRDHALQRRFLQTVHRFSLTAILGAAAFAHSCPNGDGLPGIIYAHDIKGSTLPNLVNIGPPGSITADWLLSISTTFRLLNH